jgi:hypothetical protein
MEEKTKQMNTTNQPTNQLSGIIVAFHIGRGGRFNNSGHKTYLGEHEVSYLININDANLFWKDRDEEGKFISPGFFNNGKLIITDKEAETGTGVLDFDGDYDTDIAKFIEDCTEAEIELIINDTKELKSVQLQGYISENYPELMEGNRFDKYGRLVRIEQELTDY